MQRVMTNTRAKQETRRLALEKLVELLPANYKTSPYQEKPLLDCTGGILLCSRSCQPSRSNLLAFSVEKNVTTLNHSKIYGCRR